jgi:hypothetical protein
MAESKPSPKAPTDEVGALIHAVVVILGLSGVMGRLGLTGDDVALILGSVMTIAGIVRAWWLRTHPPQPAALPPGSGG